MTLDLDGEKATAPKSKKRNRQKILEVRGGGEAFTDQRRHTSTNENCKLISIKIDTMYISIYKLSPKKT